MKADAEIWKRELIQNQHTYIHLKVNPFLQNSWSLSFITLVYDMHVRVPDTRLQGFEDSSVMQTDESMLECALHAHQQFTQNESLGDLQGLLSAIYIIFSNLEYKFFQWNI